MLSATTTTTSSPDLATSLREIGLRKTADSLDDVIARATRARLSLSSVLEEIVRAEKVDRAERSLASRLEAARLGRFKPMADFEWEWPKKIDRDAVERSLHLAFLEKTENIVLVASQGLGKTMIARNIAHAAVLAGHTTLCVSASEMLLDLGGQPTATLLDRRLRRYTHPAVLHIDEVGYISYDNRAADLLFQVVSRRYERKSTVVTTNLAFSAWSTVFPNAACALALVDRLTHHSEVIAIEGDSYRRREAERAADARKKKPRR